ncbi:MAG: S1C family serine protease [Faecousia sp.]
MDDYHYSSQDNWEYGTGRTDPPKNRTGLMAVLLILVIFLTGIVTVLGVLNIRLFRQLSASEEEGELSISFTQEETAATTAPETTAPSPDQTEFALDLQRSPQAVENVPQEGGLSLQEIYTLCAPSVVSITTDVASGTGVILSQDGYVVTNAHVVEGGSTVSVRLADDRQFPARLVGADTVSDLAVLRVDATDLTPAQFADSDRVRVGDAVVAIGDPLGAELRGTMTDGIISAINRDVTVEGRTMSLLQTNAALNSGNSGGPLIDCYGQVVGINTLKIGSFVDRAGVEGLGFAIPSSTVKVIVDQLITQGYVSGRPTLGITGETLSSFYQHYYRMPAGLLITQVDSGSTADRAGIIAGDILLTLGDTAVKDMNTLNALLNERSIGDTVQITIYRSGRQYSATLTVEEAKK